jgi:protein SCO1/2
MNDPRFAFRALVAAMLSIGIPAACGSPPETPAPLAGAKLGGAFTLTDQDGRTRRDTDFAGQYRLVYFGYTYCPDVCPVDVQRLTQGLKTFEADDPARGAKVQPIFITVDPSRDTPAVLKTFVKAFHPRLVGLTGTPAQIAEVAKRYGVSFQPQDASGAAGYLVNHTTTAILYAPDGSPIGIIAQDQGAPSVARELAQWVR